MKKYVICVTALVLFLLQSCTLLSTKIEKEMLTQVVVHEIAPQEAGKVNINLPAWYQYLGDSPFYIKQADVAQLVRNDFHLFQLKKGFGWEGDLCIREVDQNTYTFDKMNKRLLGFDETAGWKFIAEASRLPVEGNKVEVLTTKEKARERYLVIYPDRVPEINWKLKGMTIMAQTGDLLLLEVEKSPQPFLRERAGRELGDLNTPGCEIYSVDTVELFLKNLPLAAGVAVLLFAGPVVWVQALCFTGDPWKNRWWLMADTLLGLGLLWGLRTLLGRIDLPSDLLPAENILQWSHYSREFSQIFSALAETRGSLFESMKHLGRTGQHTINLALRTIKQLKTVAVIGTVLPLLWALSPVFIRVFRRSAKGSE